MNETLLKSKIPELQACTNISEINKGFSGDKKYLIEFDNGRNYLLRTSSLSNFSRKEAEFKVLREMKRYDVLIQEPISIGISVRTLRYDDEIDLVKSSKKELNGRRLYSNQDLVKLEKVQILKSLSLSLDDIKHLVEEISTINVS
ncbi:hypothetical protein JOC86_003585 [Bacillus pakistanensis]|uniref:HTH merR-type domain-containing protein n=1 Tax=Rossellomorea pakistanensis TaxID=992288 RepID=A0ABS2NGT0_9BACI|nr:MerR family transcriptional regulator [Bacillus pakistanensis]MBM7587033.1 hypothetical protein [Bacillus pakistanensis]